MKNRIIIHILFAVLFVGTSNFAHAQGSHLDLFCGSIMDTIPSDCRNKDSVMVDTCISSPTYGQLYAKQWFHVGFSYYILPTPVGPEDTIIDRTWQDIDTGYPNVRSAFAAMESKYGSFYFRKVAPTIIDTSNGRRSFFTIAFQNYVNVDSVVEALSEVPTVEKTEYLMRAGAVLQSVENNKVHMPSFSSKILLSRSSSFLQQSNMLKIRAERYNVVDVFTIHGAYITHLEQIWNTENLLHQLYTLPNGSYLIQGGLFVLVVNIID